MIQIQNKAKMMNYWPGIESDSDSKHPLHQQPK